MGWLDGILNNPIVRGVENAAGTVASDVQQVAQTVKDDFEAAGRVASGVVGQLLGGILPQPTASNPPPTVATLAARFPDAGLPQHMVGTTLDDALMNDPNQSPDDLMAKAAAMGMNTVRLGAYWDQIQPNGPGDANFGVLDAYLAAAQRHGLKVVLTVGAKGPNWPEFHCPAWSKANGPKPADNPQFRQNVQSFVKLVAEHEKDNPAICMWQVENEPFDPSGPANQWLDDGEVATETGILRAADSGKRPVMINCWSDLGRTPMIDSAFKVADIVGLDVYKAVPSTLGEGQRTHDVPQYAAQEAARTGIPVMISELQADDWADYKANASDLANLTHGLEGLGYGDFLFWRLDQNVKSDAAGDTSLDQAERQLAGEITSAG